VTLLVATVPTCRDHSGLLQADIRHVNGPSRRFHTIPGAQQSRMACKRSGVRISLAPQVRELNRYLVQEPSSGLVATASMRYAGEVDEDGRRLVVRNGHGVAAARPLPIGSRLS
jgi:hypothetical protein